MSTNIVSRSELIFIVQYRGAEDGISPFNWTTMAGFDFDLIANRYCHECSKSNNKYEYRVVEMPESEDSTLTI